MKDQLMAHLQSQWSSGMDWSNYGNKKGCWNIDHKYPLSLAKSENELYLLCHYSNLQPMWTEENVRKSNNL